MIVLAEIGSLTYDIVLFLHILAAFVAFAPAFVNPVMSALGRSAAPEAMGPLAGLQARATRTLYLPSLVVSGLAGVALIIMSDEVWKFSQTWISIAFAGWIGVGLVMGLKVLPAEKALAAGDAAAEKTISMWGGISHLLFAVVLYSMVFKPGV